MKITIHGRRHFATRSLCSLDTRRHTQTKDLIR
jgi:hypothetical protein